VKVGDIVLLKENWQITGVYYGPGVITMMDEGNYEEAGDADLAWKAFRVQWNDDWSWHDPEHLEVISDGRQ
tara:strand:+ start:698 stop:910 length:213 start_codon:yes stop_codon:yes gene_type:complete